MTTVLVFSYLGVFLLPGYAILRIAGARRHLYLLSFAISTSLLVIAQLPFRVAGGPARAYGLVYGGLLLAGLAGAYGFGRGRASGPAARAGAGIGGSWPVAGAGVVAAAMAIYGLLVGPYTEVPADFWNHLTRIRWEQAVLENGRPRFYGTTFAQLVNRDYLHGLHGMLAWFWGLTPDRIVTPAVLVLTTLYALGVYWFAFALLARLRWSILRKTSVAALTVLVTVLWLGAGVFAFVRYYALAPVMVAQVLLFAAIVLALDVLVRRQSGWWAMGGIGVLGAVMALVHVQEALFTAIMLFLLSVVALWRARGNLPRWREDGLLRRALLIFLGLSLIGGIAAAAIFGLERGAAPRPHIIPMESLFFMLPDLDILNPRYRFYEALSVFGVLVYGLFLIQRRDFRGQIYSYAGMWVPVVTVLNPAFVALYLRVESFNTLWRMAFLIPIPFVAAQLISGYWVRIRSARRGVRAGSALALLALVLALLPVNSPYFANRYSRWSSLQALDDRQSMAWLQDLVVALNELDGPKLVLTDPVTGYVLRASTFHAVPGWKFRPSSVLDLNQLLEKGGVEALARRRELLVVVNRRDGVPSRNGRASGHWRQDILKVSGYYPPGLEQSLRQRLTLVWQRDGITVFSTAPPTRR